MQTLKKFIRKIVYRIVPYPYASSFSQAGEDRVLNHLFREMGIKHPTYLDLGANNPIFGNNTYLFYLNGSRGVCVEADPSFHESLLKERKGDKCLNLAVTFDDRKEADFYIFSVPSLNTLSKEEAEFREKTGTAKIEKVIKIRLQNINDIIKENFSTAPDLLSIDIEGIDLDVLKSLDFNKYRPLALCVESITYSETREERKITDILDFVTSKGYFVYADTHINTIFVDNFRYKKGSAD
jgi:FkbM family methyltransferase